MMQEILLNSRLEKNLKETTLDYVYYNPYMTGGRNIYHISSKSLMYHYQIMMDWMTKGYILDDYDAFLLLKQEDFFKAASYFTANKDMMMQVKAPGMHYECSAICYCGPVLSESEKIFLRLWMEYIHRIQGAIFIYQNQLSSGINFYETEEKIQTFLEQQDVLDDQYIRKLSSQYQDIL